LFVLTIILMAHWYDSNDTKYVCPVCRYPCGADIYSGV
jgi:hypothetical protein